MSIWTFKLTLISLLIYWAYDPRGYANEFIIRDGVVSVSFQQEPSVDLNGDWEFFPGQLLAPRDITVDSGNRLSFSVPKSWKNQKFHYGTYRLTLHIRDAPEMLALRLQMVATAYRIWINGKEYPGKGYVSASPAEHRGRLGTQLLMFEPKETSEIVIQVSTVDWLGGMTKAPTLGVAHSMVSQKSLAGIAQGLLQGAMLMIAVYHSLLYLMRKRDRSHLFLALGCTGVFLRDATVGGVIIVHEMFESIPVFMHYSIQFVGAMCTTLGYFLFTHCFFPKAFSKWLLRTVVITEFMAMALTFMVPAEWIRLPANLHFIGSIVAIGFGIPGVFRQVRNKEPYSQVFFQGIAIFCLIALIDLLLVSNGTIPSISLVSLASCVFSFFQAALLAMKNAKAHQDLENEQKKNFHAYQELSKLVYPHQINLLKRGEILEQTMPVGDSHAIVMQFDIVDSSRLASSVAKSFFEKIFTRTNEVLMRGYDPQHLLASGYRIKELGDGFLCSIGFPFHTPDGRQAESLALDLAEEFVRIFQEEEAYLDHSIYGRLHCAIGIASGPLTGYFPQAGLKNYDLFGSGIILATRYESIRKHLFDKIDPTAIIIVQNRVFECLPAVEQKIKSEYYRIYDLLSGDFRVRNDPHAEYFYFMTSDSLASRRSA